MLKILHWDSRRRSSLESQKEWPSLETYSTFCIALKRTPQLTEGPKEQKSWNNFDIHLSISSMKVKLLFIMTFNLLNASMTLEKAVLLTSSPWVRKGSTEVVPSSPRSWSNYFEKLLICHYRKSDSTSIQMCLKYTQIIISILAWPCRIQRDCFFPSMNFLTYAEWI